MPSESARALLMLSSVVSLLVMVTSLSERKSLYQIPMGSPSGSSSPAMMTLGSFSGSFSGSLLSEQAVKVQAIARVAMASSHRLVRNFLVSFIVVLF